MILTSKSKDIYFTVANQPDDKLLLFNINKRKYVTVSLDQLVRLFQLVNDYELKTKPITMKTLKDRKT